MAAQFPSICYIKGGLCCTVESQNKPEKISPVPRRIAVLQEVNLVSMLLFFFIIIQGQAVFTLPLEMRQSFSHFSQRSTLRLSETSIRTCPHLYFTVTCCICDFIIFISSHRFFLSVTTAAATSTIRQLPVLYIRFLICEHKKQLSQFSPPARLCFILPFNPSSAFFLFSFFISLPGQQAERREGKG